MACISWCRRFLALLLLIPALALGDQAMVYRAPLKASLEEAPPDLTTVVLSMVALLRGLSDTTQLSPVEFAPGVTNHLRDAYTRLEGFDMAGFRLAYLGPSSSGQLGRRVIGSVAFVDQNGRRAEMGFAIDYVLQGAGVLVREAAIKRQAPPQPRVLMHLVPAKRVPPDFFERVRPFGEMLVWLSQNAIEPQKTPSPSSDPVYVFALGLDRLGIGDRLVLDAAGKLPQTLLDMGGWQMAVSRFDVLPETPLAVKAEYQPEGSGKARLELATITLPGR